MNHIKMVFPSLLKDILFDLLVLHGIFSIRNLSRICKAATRLMCKPLLILVSSVRCCKLLSSLASPFDLIVKVIVKFFYFFFK